MEKTVETEPSDRFKLKTLFIRPYVEPSISLILKNMFYYAILLMSLAYLTSIALGKVVFTSFMLILIRTY